MAIEPKVVHPEEVLVLRIFGCAMRKECVRLLQMEQFLGLRSGKYDGKNCNR